MRVWSPTVVRKRRPTRWLSWAGASLLASLPVAAAWLWSWAVLFNYSDRFNARVHGYLYNPATMTETERLAQTTLPLCTMAMLCLGVATALLLATALWSFASRTDPPRPAHF